MLKTVETSRAQKTKGLAVTYRAGSKEKFSTCPASCELNPSGCGATDVDLEYLDALSNAVPTKGIAFTYSHFAPRYWMHKNGPGKTVINFSAKTPRMATYVCNAVPTVVTVPPASVRAAVGRASGSVNDVLHIASWPVQRSSGSPVFYSTINNRPYYYYLRKSDDRCVVRAQHARYRTEQWYLRLIAMKVPIEPFHATNNPDPLQKLLTVTKDGTSTVHTTYQ